MIFRIFALAAVVVIIKAYQPSRQQMLARSFMSLSMDNDKSSDQPYLSSDQPHSLNSKYNKNNRVSSLSTAMTAMTVALATVIQPAPARAAAKESVYLDSKNGFSLKIEPGWATMIRKTPTATMLQYLGEKVLFTGSRFNEGGGRPL
jgi:hypothetical protein